MEQQNISPPSSLQPPVPKGIKPIWPIVLLVLAVMLVGVLLWQKNNANQIAESLQQQIVSLQNQMFQKNTQPNDIQATQANCVQEGQTYSVPSKLICCNSLIGVLDASIREDGQCIFKSGSSYQGNSVYACVSCGNGVCGKGENQCNCPADCKSGAVTAKIISAVLYNDKKDNQGITVEFSGAIDRATVTNDTVKICAISVSAGSSGSKSCSSVKSNNLDPANGVVLGFPGYTNKPILVVEPKFGFGCAACSWGLEISGVKDANGNILQNMNFDLGPYITNFSG